MIEPATSEVYSDIPNYESSIDSLMTLLQLSQHFHEHLIKICRLGGSALQTQGQA